MRNLIGWDEVNHLLCWIFVAALLASCTTVTKVVCPQLAPPPAAIVDSLEDLGASDPNVAIWSTQLSNQYHKQEACKP